MNSAHIILIAKLTAKPGAEATLAEALRSIVGRTREEPGCMQYIPHVSESDPRTFIIYEQWQDEAALTKHMTMPYVLELMNRMPELVAGPPTREDLRALA